MSREYRREYLLRLPMPLAQLYSRANNARDELSRLASSFAVFEVAVKLAASTATAAYLEGATGGEPRVKSVDRVLEKLEQPSLTDWMTVLEATSRQFGTRPDSVSHPLGHLWSQLSEPRTKMPWLLAWRAQLEEKLGEEAVSSETCSVLQVLETAVAFSSWAATDERATQTISEGNLEPAALAAVNELLDEGVVDLIGPPDSRLVYVTGVRSVDAGRVKVEMRELLGVQGERLDPVTLDSGRAAGLSPQRVAVLWPGRAAPLPLDPLLHYRESEMSAEVLFLEQGVADKYVELQSYVTGETVRDESLAPSFARLTSGIHGTVVSEGPMQTIVDIEPVNLSQAPLEPNEIRLRLLELIEEGAATQWVFNEGDTISIGRVDDNNALINDPRVSRNHAVVVHDENGWQYTNKGTNGTFMAGQKVEQFTIQSGDVVQLAGTGPRIQFDLPVS